MSEVHECRREGEISRFLKEMDTLSQKVDAMEKENASKVSWTVFWSIITLLVVVCTGVFNKIEADETAETANLQAQINAIERADKAMEEKINDGDKVQVKILTQLEAIISQLSDLQKKFK